MHPTGQEPWEMVERLSGLSNTDLCNELVALLASDHWRQWFITWKGSEAQTLINMLQAVRYDSLLNGPH